MRELEKRIRRLETGEPPGFDGPQIISIRGGVPGDDGLHASVGALRLRADPGEDREGFIDRCIDEAVLLGVRWVILGGLPDEATEDDFPSC
jgi:hypothetical protein